MNDEPAKVDLETPDVAAEKRVAFEKLFPGVIADGILDAARLGEILDAEVTSPGDGGERFGLMWAGKQDAIRSLQTPSRGTLVPEPSKSIGFDDAQNVFVEGDNLEVLKLLQKAYNDRVKLIYIDPPYNTGNDFVYGDDFTDSLGHYLRSSGQLDADGHRTTASVDAGGRRHSRWISMMYPRLIMARNLLTEDGFIFISIDDGEIAPLRLICDEIFGAENFATTIMWKRKRETSNDSRNVAVQGEYLLVYSRTSSGKLKPEPLDQAYLDASYRQPTDQYPDGLWRPVPITVSKGLKGGGYSYPITTPGGVVHDRLWGYPQRSYQELVDRGRVYFGAGGTGVPQRVIYAHESAGKPTSNYWDSTASNKEGKKAILDIFGDNVFETPKPVGLIRRILQLIPGDDYIVLDFFAGSGTTAHATAEQNASDGGTRRTVSVNLPEPTGEKSIANRSGFSSVSDVTTARLQWVASRADREHDGGLRVFKLTTSCFRFHEPADELFSPATETLVESVADDRAIVAEVLLKEGVPLHEPWTWHDTGGSPIVSAGGVTVVLSREITELVLANAFEIGGVVLVVLEDALAGFDALKANAVRTAKNRGIVLKTV